MWAGAPAAAAGWPLAELWDTGIAKTLGLEPIIEENGGRAVSVLNGGMGMISPVYWVSVVLFAGAVEALSEYKKGQAKAADSQWMLTGSYVPGDLGFDPLGLGVDPRRLAWYQEAELAHGRWAMAAVVGVVAAEAVGAAPWWSAGAASYALPANALLAIQFAAMGVLELKRLRGFLETGESGFWSSFPFDPLGLRSDANRVAEVKHGRLGMLAMALFYYLDWSRAPDAKSLVAAPDLNVRSKKSIGRAMLFAAGQAQTKEDIEGNLAQKALGVFGKQPSR